MRYNLRFSLLLLSAHVKYETKSVMDFSNRSTINCVAGSSGILNVAALHNLLY